MRLHPFAYAFEPLADRFPAIRDAAEALRRDTRDRAQFAALSEVQHLLQEIEAPDVLSRDPEAGVEYLAALHAAFCFWRDGKRTVSLSRAALEASLGEGPPSDADFEPYTTYYQLPERWFWAQTAPAGPHEPLDGVFVVPGAGRRDLTVLAVLGLRDDRGGFSQITVTTTLEDARRAASGGRTPPFAPLVPGGEAAGLRSLATVGEVLHLSLLAAAHRGG
jgi:hypothetical protein